MKDKIITILSSFIAALIMAFIIPWIVMLLWNVLIPAIFGLTTITYWQSFGLSILVSFLFGHNSSYEELSRQLRSKDLLD